MMSKLFKLAAPLMLVAATGAAQAQSPDWVRIEGFSYAGTGCPAGSVSDNLSWDGKALTLLFDSFVASYGPGIPFSEKRKNCTITAKIRFPNGWSYSLYTVDYRGFMDLQPGVNGTQTSTYYFQGQGGTGRATSNWYGPRTGDYHVRDTLRFDQTIWSPCGATRDLVINASVLVDNARAPRNSGLLTVDTIDQAVHQIYKIQWRRC